MFRKVLLAATFLSIAAAAHVQAQPVTGLYVGAGVGWNYLAQEQIKGISVASSRVGNLSASNLNNRNINFGSGVGALANVGWGFGNGVRVELEGNYRGNYRNQNGDARTVSQSVSNRINVLQTGGEQKAGLMVNGAYDFVDAFGHGITPYIGAGIGWQHVEFGTTRLQGYTPAGRSFTTNNSGGVDAFAYQAILGTSYNWTSMSPNLYLTAEYRFMGVGGDRGSTGQIVTQGGSSKVTVSSGPEANHAIIFGVRYAFNAPTPPPAPIVPPAPAPRPVESRSYLVFFDWDSAALTDRARQIVAEAAAVSSRVKATVIEVNGHTDLTGSSSYNKTLSVRRAEIVAAELVKNGVPQSEIFIHGYGDANPLVPTAAGVREPQNRRVDIILK